MADVFIDISERESLFALFDHEERAVRELVEDVADAAAENLRQHAPGNFKIAALVAATRASRLETGGGYEATAGVTRDPQPGGGNPDWPVFPDIGTGRHGEFQRDIVSPAGNMMVFEYQGRTIFTRKVKGQEAQHYSDEAYLDTLFGMPVHIEAFKAKLAASDWTERLGRGFGGPSERTGGDYFGGPRRGGA